MVIYGIDFGATNLRLARVDPGSGDILEQPTYLALEDFRSSEELTRRLFSLIPHGSSVGICSAGVVDEEAMTIRFSANTSLTEDITFGRELQERHGCRVTQTNDIKAAVQAVARFGEGRGHANVLLATYSSGFNCALTRSGKNVTTAEFGHTIYKPDADLYCGCGGRGHLEIYVSGNGAASMARQYLSIRKLRRHRLLELALEDINRASGRNLTPRDLDEPSLYGWALESVSAKHVYRAFAEDPSGEPQADIRRIQVRAIADSFGRMNSVYNPVDIIVLMGSQTNDWDALFEPAVELYRSDDDTLQLSSMPKPPVVKTRVQELGIRGAAAHHLSLG